MGNLNLYGMLREWGKKCKKGVIFLILFFRLDFDPILLNIVSSFFIYILGRFVVRNLEINLNYIDFLLI